MQSFLDYIQPSVRSMAPYQGGRPIAEVKRQLGPRNFIKLASNECPYPTSLAVREALAEAAQSVNFYPDGKAHALIQRLAQATGLAAQHITLGNGSNEILELLVLALCSTQRGDCILTSRHAFLVYKLLAASHAIGFVEAELNNWVVDMDAMLRLVDERTRLVCLASPGNPIGTVVEPAALEAFLARLPATTLLVLDQAYADFYPSSDDCLQLLNSYPNLIITRTFSKAMGLAGLRIGYALSSPELADMLNRVRQPFNVNSLAQAAALAALDDAPTLHKTIANNAVYRDKLQALCASLGLATLPGQANFLTIDFTTAESATRVEQGLLHKGIIVRNIANYQLPTMLRITIGTPEQMERLFAVLSRLCASA